MANKKLSVGRRKKRSRSGSGTYSRPPREEQYQPHAAPVQAAVRERQQPSVSSTAQREREQMREKYERSSAKKAATHTAGKKRNKKKNRSSMSGSLWRAFIGMAILVIAIPVLIFVLFKIGSIKVTGNELYSTAQIVEASEIELGDNLFAPSSAATQKKFDTALPYIKSVRLQHKLPDTLVICVEETQAKYAFKVGTKFLLTDADLKLLEVSEKLPHGAGVIEGVGLKGAEIGEIAAYKDSQKGDYVERIFKGLSKNKLDNITLISVKNPVDLTAVYNDQITILFGQADDLEYKCALAATAIRDIMKENKNSEGTINVKQAAQTGQAYFNPSAK